MRRFASALVSLSVFALAALGCETTTDSSLIDSVSGSVTTSLLVDPSEFLGDIPCANISGAMQSYVAFIYDVTNLQNVVTLPAAPPVSCSAGVTFSQVVVGRQYRVKIDGYDVPASKLVPLASGSRTMQLKTDTGVAGPVVPPRWQTSCADITTVSATRKIVDKCEPFPEGKTTTGITVDPRIALKSATPALACKQAMTGDVFSWDVRPDNPSLPALLNLPCSEDETAPLAFTSGIVPGQTYAFRIEARAEAGGPVVWGSSCVALAKDGLVVDAACDPLQADGAIDIVVGDLLGPDTCTDPAKVNTYDVSLGSLSAKGVSCAKSVRFAPLSPGVHAATLVGYRSTGDISVEATCTAVVEPGKVSVATCTVL